jgi:hypothetical protein
VVAFADIVFSPGSVVARLAAAYRKWLGLAPHDVGPRGPTRPHKRHKVDPADVDLSQPLDLVVLALRSNSIRCRVLGTEREITLRTAVRWEVPGEIITVAPTRQWTHAGHPYLSGRVRGSRLDVRALGLAPLGLTSEGDWDPGEEYWGDEGEPLDDWAKPIVARGKRPAFEMEQVLPGADPDNWDTDPIVEASELNAAGDHRAAERLLMKELAEDLRCLDAHAHLGARNATPDVRRQASRSTLSASASARSLTAPARGRPHAGMLRDSRRSSVSGYFLTSQMSAAA